MDVKFGSSKSKTYTFACLLDGQCFRVPDQIGENSVYMRCHNNSQPMYVNLFTGNLIDAHDADSMEVIPLHQTQRAEFTEKY